MSGYNMQFTGDERDDDLPEEVFLGTTKPPRLPTTEETLKDREEFKRRSEAGENSFAVAIEILERYHH